MPGAESLESSATLRVSITDANDPPQFVGTASECRLSENGPTDDELNGCRMLWHDDDADHTGLDDDASDDETLELDMLRVVALDDETIVILNGSLRIRRDDSLRPFAKRSRPTAANTCQYFLRTKS